MNMVRQTLRNVSACLIGSLAVAASVHAQDPRVEIGGTAGYTLSDGVTFDGVLADDGNIYDGIEPKDSFSWSLSLGFLINPNVEIGFLYGQQKSTLQVTGTNTREIGDQDLDNYHGYFAFNFGESDATVRPYFMIGAGATRYGSVPFTVGAVSGETESNTKFSGIAGAGFKLYPSPRVGVNIGVRWVPTYIKSDEVGWWCDPYWGCYVVGDAQYSNQFHFQGGLFFRF
jgi:Outer membrane protein beta-barrel domain